ILEEQIKDLNLSSIIDGNLSKIDENLSLVVEQNLSKEENLTKDMNLSKTKQARLAIIIDDMANISQVRALQALKLKLIPSFFPPDKNHIDTPKLALKFDFYMVHLPLAAMNYTKPELDTLNPSDSEKRIFKKIQQVKKDFKDLKFINNHTGSLFTSDEKAMKKLYKAFEKEELIFVDSKTIASSKAPKVAKALGQIYIQRDVFLDNRDDVAYIKNQLIEAVRLAKQKGFAIAIGHPRKNTFKALEQSKDLLKSVELVYLSEIYAK
ncbi:TPA: divergent polysaccharide deacetylase family protein, partial [Campylobacter coli]|nr:divergent polysaccharide deacetylase family protein [Campylobacter coli]HEE9622992.1 divergent polysaccharide deacetylase family protein [Campylobacter coli]